MHEKCYELADKICLDSVAVASLSHFICYYADKISKAEAQRAEVRLCDALKQHIERCNELIALHS